MRISVLAAATIIIGVAFTSCSKVQQNSLDRQCGDLFVQINEKFDITDPGRLNTFAGTVSKLRQEIREIEARSGLPQ